MEQTMSVLSSRILGKVLMVILWMWGLSGCAATAPPLPQENLVVPPISAQLGRVNPKQNYVLARATAMKAMDPGAQQPEIHVTYDPRQVGPAPAEALERVGVTPWGTETQTYQVWVNGSDHGDGIAARLHGDL